MFGPSASPGPDSKSLLNIHKAHTLSDTKPTSEELVTTLAELLENFRRCHIVIDALDELGEHNDRISLLKALVLLQQKLGSSDEVASAGPARLTNIREDCNVSPLIMSRNIQDIHIALRITWLEEQVVRPSLTSCAYVSYELPTTNKSDVRLCLDWRMKNDSSLETVTAKRIGLRDEILASVIEGSGSM